MAIKELQSIDYQAIRRKVRLISLLDAAELAGIDPIPIQILHAFAYLSNVLAPVWDLRPLDGKILKRNGGPFYPALQHDLDALVGAGIAFVSSVDYVKFDDDCWRLEGEYVINREKSQAVINALYRYEDELKTVTFIRELGFAFSSIGLEELSKALLEDATYSDPIAGVDNVIDFAEWKQLNYSTNAANKFADYYPEESLLSPGNKLHLYVRHLYRRVLNAAG